MQYLNYERDMFSWRGALLKHWDNFTFKTTQPPIQWVSGALSLGVKRPEREAYHSPPSSTEVKECMEIYLHSPNTYSRHDDHLKHRNNFTDSCNETHLLKTA
jgi:hypothetical protein